MRGVTAIGGAGLALAAPVLVAVLTVLCVGLLDVPAASAQGCSPRLVVSKTDGLAPGGETVTVSGSCYDVNKGVYVGFCVVPPPGSMPTPCGGGIDMGGMGGLSHWISSNPPPQGVGLAVPYGPGGSFTVTVRPAQQLNAQVDCRRVRCAIVTRADHTRSSDRSMDVIIPVTFADPAPAPAPTAPAIAIPDLSGLATTTTTAPPEETTTTTVEEATTTTSTTAPAAVDDDGDDATDLAVTTASSSSSGGSGTAVAIAVVVVLLVVAAGGGWWALRRRGAGPAGSGE